MNEKVAGAEKQVTEAEKQMQKVGKTATMELGNKCRKQKNSYHGNRKTNVESIKLL